MTNLGFLFVLTASLAHAGETTLTILPAEVTLTGPRFSHRLLAVQQQGADCLGSAASTTWHTSDPNVVVMENGIAVARGAGTAVVTVTTASQTAEARVTVVGDPAAPAQWTFRNHVQSVLSKNQCNMGACHGAAAGKNGFRLSLRGYDPEFDFLSITRQARGRRISSEDPGRSLLLTKPTGMIPHKGGVRLSADSFEYQVIADWIAAGQPAPQPADARILRIQMLPSAVRLVPGVTQQLVVQAHFSDGSVEDVTRWCKFSSTNHSVAQVDDVGLVTVSGHGEGGVVAWYLAQNAVATITAPYPTEIDPAAFDSESQPHLIDALVLAKLKSINLPPSPVADDAEFLRRVYLDTIGVLPTLEEATTFFANTAPTKRTDVIEQLLKRPEFVDYWTYRWSDLFLVSGQRLRPEAIKTFNLWIREQVEKNVPWDQVARGILLAQGSTFQNGAANFYALHQDPLEMSETLSMAFLGMSINCCRCHDHPLEKWTNDDYYGMVSLFARTRGKGWGGDFRNGDGNRTIFTDVHGEVIQPRTGRPQPPKPLDGAAIDMASEDDRRETLVNWLVDPSNPYFSRAMINRVWANFMARGLVESVDDLRLTNPASNEPLFAALEQDFEAHGYDLQRLMRLILTSQTYQRSSQIVPGNEPDDRYHARAYPRRLKGEVILDALSQVTKVPTKFPGLKEPSRAMQLADTSVASYFLGVFGRPERVLTCECERSDNPSMTQVLHLTNGDTLREKLEGQDNRITEWLAEEVPFESLVTEIYLTTLTRLPTANETTSLVAEWHGATAEDRRALLEDLLWSLCTSREFLFRH